MNRKIFRIANYFLEKCFFVLAKTNIGCTFAPLFQKSSESVAQQVEHIPFKDGVLGSSPSWFTIAKQQNPQAKWFGDFLLHNSLIAKLPYNKKRRSQAAFLCVITMSKDSNQWNVVLIAGFPHIVGPDAGLDFANVSFAQEEHAEPRLADAAAN